MTADFAAISQPKSASLIVFRPPVRPGIGWPGFYYISSADAAQYTRAHGQQTATVRVGCVMFSVTANGKNR